MIRDVELACATCRRVFDRSECETREESNTSEFWGAVETQTVKVLLCPHCGSEDIGEHKYPEVYSDE